MEDHLLQHQEKSSGTNRCLLALLSLVAIAGVGIGVFSVVHSSSLQGDINELRSQLKTLQNNTPASNATVGKLMAEVQAVEGSITSINQFLGDDSVVTTLQCLDDTTKLVYASNGMAVARCPANCDASVSASHLWGTHIYSASSSICLAAVHDGELQLSAGGIVRVVQQPGQKHYTGSTQNGVTSSDKDASQSSFNIGTTLRQNVSDAVDGMQGELRVFYAQVCPPGWVEDEMSKGYLLVGRPTGVAAGKTNQMPPLGAAEIGRVGPHRHEIDDPGHTHTMDVSLSWPGSHSNHPTDYNPGAVAYQARSSTETTGISVKQTSDDYYPLLYVTICHKAT